MPVACMSMRECVDYPFSGKSSYDERIFIDVDVIIKIDEIMTQRLTEYGPRDCHQTKADEEVGDPWFRTPAADTRARARGTGRMLSAV